MTLIPYAGFDINDTKHSRQLLKPKYAYRRFLEGQNIAQLSRFYKVSQRTVQRWIDEGRRKAEQEPQA